MITDIPISSLEVTDPHALHPKRLVHLGLAITRVEVPSPAFSRFLYTAVGGDWYWVDRLPWTYQQWHDWAARPTLHTWVAYVTGTPAGYFELEEQAEHTVEIVSFGLMTPFLGQGLGAIC